MSVLQIFRGDDFLEEIVLSRAVMGLGRHPQNDIVLDDRSLSRFHARVERRGDRFVVVDCGAQNGVHLNGQRVVGESDLTPGDRITLGRYVAIFDASAAARATPPRNELRAAPPPAKNGEPSSRAPLKSPPGEPDLDVEVDDGARKRGGREAAGGSKNHPEPTLVLLFNGMEVSRHPVTDGLIIGRSKQSDVVISLLGLSRKHARVSRTRDTISVEDLGSQNGTWVNNQRISGPRKLKHGDLLNFYDYAVLFLEDGDVEVGFPGTGFAPPEGGRDDLSNLETNQSASRIKPPSKPGSPRASVSLADSQVSPRPFGAVPSQSELVDLGEGSFLGDDFDDGGASADDGLSASLLEEDPLAGIEDIGGVDLEEELEQRGGATDVVEGLDLGSALKLDASRGVPSSDGGAFDEGGGKLEVKATSTVGELAHMWAGDDEILQALSNAPDTMLVTLEVMLGGKPYTQMPLSQTVTRVGTDARCELSLPKASGLMPWHMTLLHLGGAVVLYRAARSGRIHLRGREVDMATLRDGDLLDLGKVRVKVRAK